MPTIECRSRIRAASDLCSLALNVRHHLVAGKASDTPFSLSKKRFPDNVDILLTSNLVVTLSGTVDGSDVSAKEILASSLSGHLVDYFRTNATELGLNTVSKLYIDDDDGLAKLILTPSRQVSVNSETHHVHVVLVALDLCYSWQITGSSASLASSNSLHQASHPFALKLALPFRTLLDNVVGRFATWQLVKRYPLIFGPWCQQLDHETFYFPGIFCSILNIMKRSPNAAFRTKCERLIKMLRRLQKASFDEASLSLLTYLSSIREDKLSRRPTKMKLTAEDVLCLAMERVYRNRLTRPQFKSATQSHRPDPADDEDLSQDHNLLPAEHRARLDGLWDDPFKDVLPRSFSPRVDPFLFLDVPTGSSMTLPMDLELDHSDEGLLEGDEWSEEDLEIEYAHDYEQHHSLYEHDLVSAEDDIGRYEGYIVPPVVSNFGNDDACCGPFLLSPLRSEHFDDDLLEAAESKICSRILVDGHVAAQTDPSNTVSQDLPGIGPRPQATASSSQCSPSISGPLFQDVNGALDPSQTRCMLTETISQWTEGWADIDISDYEDDAPDSFISYDPLYDDMDLNIPSDAESNMSTVMERDSADNRNLRRGASVAVVAGPATASSSHQLSSLSITCRLKEDQLREHEEEREDVHEDQWHEESGVTGQDGNSVARTEDCGGDVLFVMEF